MTIPKRANRPTAQADVRRRCSNCAHAIIPRRRNRTGMPPLICEQSDEAGWGAVREFSDCCAKWQRKASNASLEARASKANNGGSSDE